MAPENPKTAPATRAISVRDRIGIISSDPRRFGCITRYYSRRSRVNRKWPRIPVWDACPDRLSGAAIERDSFDGGSSPDSPVTGTGAAAAISGSSASSSVKRRGPADGEALSVVDAQRRDTSADLVGLHVLGHRVRSTCCARAARWPAPSTRRAASFRMSRTKLPSIFSIVDRQLAQVDERGQPGAEIIQRDAAAESGAAAA